MTEQPSTPAADHERAREDHAQAVTDSAGAIEDRTAAAGDHLGATHDHTGAQFDRVLATDVRLALKRLQPKGQRGWRDLAALVLILIIGFGIGALVRSFGAAPLAPARLVARTCPVAAGATAPVIQAAMKLCAGGGTVEIAAGTYPLTAHLVASYPNEIVSGAGQTLTLLVQHARVNIFQITAPSVTIENMSVDTGSFNPGVPPVRKNPVPGTIFSNQSHTSILNVTSNAGTGFGMRITGPSPCDTFQTTGTIVSNVSSTNTGGGGFTALDIDCTNGATLTNIVIHGDYIAFYQVENILLNGEVSTPGPYNGKCTAPWYVSGPSNHLLLENVHSNGGAGIAKASKRGPVTFLSTPSNTKAAGC